MLFRSRRWRIPPRKRRFVAPRVSLAARAAQHPDAPPLAVIADEGLGAGELAALHELGDCYLSLTRTEGWGLGAFEAALRGVPVVMTGYGGQLDFLDPDLARLVDHTMIPAVEPAWPLAVLPETTWAQADLEHAGVLLHEVVSDLPAARRQADELAARLAERYAPERIAHLIEQAVQP